MNDQNIREDFEAHYQRPLSVVWNVDKRCYYTLSGGAKFKRELEIYNARWEAWQASRAAIVVKLPDTKTIGVCDAYNRGVRAYRDVMKRAIERAGMGVKL